MKSLKRVFVGLLSACLMSGVAGCDDDVEVSAVSVAEEGGEATEEEGGEATEEEGGEAIEEEGGEATEEEGGEATEEEGGEAAEEEGGEATEEEGGEATEEEGGEATEEEGGEATEEEGGEATEEEGGEATEEEGGEATEQGDFELLGDYEDNTFMSNLTISEAAWSEESMDQTSEFAYSITHNIVSFDNDADWLVVESGWEPGTYDLVVYVEEPSVDGFYACTASFGNATAEDAAATDLSLVDFTNPAGETSCGGTFSFTLWEAAAPAAPTFELLGDYEDNTFMSNLTISDTAWSEESMDQTSEFAYSITHNIVSFDNDADWLVVESGWEPGTYDLVVYVEEPSVGGFYACTASFGNATAEDAAATDLSLVDFTNPAGETSCGGTFSFTLWEGIVD